MTNHVKENLYPSMESTKQEEFDDTKQVTIIVYQRRTDNTMAKRKRTNNDLQNIHIKLKIE